MGLILFIAAMIGQVILLPVFFFYTCFKFLFTLQFKKLNDYLYFVAFAIDQAGNVWGGVMMNDCLLKDKTKKAYGNPDETISYATGISKKNDNLNKLGKLVAKMLNKADKNHVEKAAETDQCNVNNSEFNLRKSK